VLLLVNNTTTEIFFFFRKLIKYKLGAPYAILKFEKKGSLSLLLDKIFPNSMKEHI
jgi:hypothetical protein